ncbi:MAG: hypothetical protein QOC79_938, partial [Actinomycetota bacterium]|nr:hypothetical protein [Actinomycetota bacterium]
GLDDLLPEPDEQETDEPETDEPVGKASS